MQDRALQRLASAGLSGHGWSPASARFLKDDATFKFLVEQIEGLSSQARLRSSFVAVALISPVVPARSVLVRVIAVLVRVAAGVLASQNGSFLKAGLDRIVIFELWYGPGRWGGPTRLSFKGRASAE